MERFLYGASVQGIQGFIFQTNKLKDIVGASELVEKICTDVFISKFNDSSCKLILNAAGNVKCVFYTEEACRKAVLLFPKLVMEYAPGITVSQAVVKYDGDFNDAVDRLELRLRIQRNRQAKSMTQGSIAIERSRKTGLPAVPYSTGDYVDEGTRAKDKAVDEDGVTDALYHKIYGDDSPFRNVINLSQLTGKNDWIAIIHADGNGLGEIVSQIKNEEALNKFSRELNDSTISAARKACCEVHERMISRRALIRPIVIGGDDLTVICRADVAVPFVKRYLKYFEEETDNKEHICGKLTACAGISFVKASYPFYFGYDLAEALCSIAKKDAKSEEMKNLNNGEIASCLMFHKVQSSFVEDYSVIKQKELTPADGLSFCFGPYYLKEQKTSSDESLRWSIEHLEEKAEHLSNNDENNMIKTRVREWMTVLNEGKSQARQIQERVKSFNQYSPSQKDLFNELVAPVSRNGEECYPAYDVLALHTITNQETK